MIRAFVALPLPDPVLDALVAAQAGLPAGRPLPRENMHLTLAFLGEHPMPVVEDVHHALGTIRAPAFDITLAGLGLFGADRPRVLHAGIAPDPGLKHLRAKVLQAGRDAGLEFDRARFHPHVTLARFGHGLTPDEVARLHAFVLRGGAFRAGPFTAERFVLYRSRLGRDGSHYEELADYPLRAA
jgi:RNA 2',3'-cyclic 3'-phosphodiesterase